MEHPLLDEAMLKIFVSPKQTNEIKGKIYKPDGGLLYPRFLLQDDIETTVKDIRRMNFSEIKVLYDQPTILHTQEALQSKSAANIQKRAGKKQPAGCMSCFSRTAKQ